MRRLVALALALGLVGCGPDDAGGATVRLALTPAILDELATLQIVFVKAGGSLDCARARSNCAKDAGLELHPLADGKPALVAPFDRALATTTGQPLRARVGAGTWLVLVEGLDAAGALVANGCALRVDVKAGATSEVDVALDDYTGPACQAAIP